MKSSKKSQVTMFVILALVLLIVLAIIYGIFRARGTVEDEEFRDKPVPEEFKPVENYVINCIHQKGLEAINLLGEHGGYIDPEDSYFNGEVYRIDASAPSRSEFVSFSLDEVVQPVPYYLFVPGKASSNNFVIDSMLPSVEEMEGQLSKYLERELINCQGDFSELAEKGFKVDASSDVDAVTKISSTDVTFYVTQKIEMTKDEVKTEKSEFATVIRHPLLRYYNLAVNITRTAFISGFTEVFAGKLIDYYSGLDFELLPPKGTTTNHEPYMITWSIQKARLDLQGLLLSNVPSLQVNASKNYEEIPGTGIDIEFLKANTIYLQHNKNLLENIEIDFLYLNQPIELDINPSKGDLLKPSINVQPGEKMVPSSRTNTYRFFYDVSWPVIIIIREEDPQNEVKDFKYIFALESNIIENKGMLEWMLGLGTVPYSYSDIDLIFDYTAFSDVAGSGAPVTYEPRGYTKSLFCNEEAWLSGDVKLRLEDAVTGQPLEKANIIYSCGDYDSCWAGQTEIINGIAVWEGKLPICQGGLLTIEKSGFDTITLMLSTQEGVPQNLGTQRIYEFKEMTIDVKKQLVQKDFVYDSSEGNWSNPAPYLGALLPIDPNTEQVMLTFTKQDLVSLSPYSTTAVFGKDVEGEVKVNLVPGSYAITANVLDESGIHIPAQCSYICMETIDLNPFTWGTCNKKEHFPKEPFDMPVAMYGGVEINDETTGNFEITGADLMNSQVLEIRVIKPPYPPCMEQLQELAYIGDYSTQFRDAIMPVFR